MAEAPSIEDIKPAATPRSQIVLSNSISSLDDEAKPGPWEKSVPPENLLQLSHTLWDISTGKLIDTQWIADGIRPIPELPGLYWPIENDKSSGVPGFAPKLLAPNGLALVKPIPEVSHGQLLTSTDHHQFVEIKLGDLWITDVNWKDNSVSSPKRLTNVGEYEQSQLLAWYGNEVYLYTRKPEDKPVVRVNTETGEMENLPYLRAQQGQHSSPDRRFRVHHGQSDMMLHVYDFATHEEFTIDGFHAFRRQGVVSKDHKFGVAIEPEFWVSNTQFFNMSAWYDLEKREQNLITDWPELINKFPRNVSVRNVLLVPGGDFIDISIEGYEEFTNDRKQKGPIKQRYRINRQTDELIKLPAMPSVGWNKDAVWVDTERYLFFRSEGTQQEIGLWLYDIPSQQSTLLSDLAPNHRFRTQNVQSASFEHIEGFKPAFKTSPFLVISAHQRVGFSTEVNGKSVFAFISLVGEQPMYLELPKKRLTPTTANLFVNDPFAFASLKTVVKSKTRQASIENANDAAKTNRSLLSLQKASSNGRPINGFEANTFSRVPWEEQADYFTSFPFETGNYSVASDPSGTFRDLYVRTYQGRVVLGDVPEYKVFPRNDQRKQFVNAFKSRLTHSTDQYGLLCALKEQKDEFTSEKILYRKGYGNYYISKSGFKPFPIVTALAYGAIKSEHFGQYFCTTPNNCNGYEDRSRANSAINIERVWGGTVSSEPESKQALTRFLDNELPKLIAWAEPLSCNVALAVPVYGEDYDSANQTVSFSYRSNKFSMPFSDSEYSSVQGNRFYALVNASFSKADIGAGIPNV